MFLAYVYVNTPEYRGLELTLVPDKPDQFSLPIPVDSLVETTAALLRISPLEAMVVKKDPEGDILILEPAAPSKLFITPDLHDKPGVSVKTMRIQFFGGRNYQITYIQDADTSNTWREWNPLKRRQ